MPSSRSHPSPHTWHPTTHTLIVRHGSAQLYTLFHSGKALGTFPSLKLAKRAATTNAPCAKPQRNLWFSSTPSLTARNPLL